MNRSGLASLPSSSVAASSSVLSPTAGSSTGAGGRPHRGPSNRSHCVLACIFLFSIASIVLAWSFLIYENLHPRAVTDPQLHTNTAGLTGLSDTKKDPTEGRPSNKVSESRVVYEREMTDNVAKIPSPISALKKSMAAAPYTYPTTIHFIHIPKCGGTSMSAVLRQLMCQMNHTANSDCCTNPGFCDWHAQRRCNAIKGCTNHYPLIKFLKNPSIPSVTMFREPVSRLISAYFYRGHSPNNDYFQVRPEFKEIREGKRPKVSFASYLEMPEYNNIMTRMLAADSFPYKNISIGEEQYQTAIKAVDALFFAGLQEAYEMSISFLTHEFHIEKLDIELPKERSESSKRTKEAKAAILADPVVMQRAREVNSYDIRLYEYVVRRFCSDFSSRYPEEFAAGILSSRVNCPL